LSERSCGHYVHFVLSSVTVIAVTVIARSDDLNVRTNDNRDADDGGFTTFATFLFGFISIVHTTVVVVLHCLIDWFDWLDCLFGWWVGWVCVRISLFLVLILVFCCFWW